MTQKSEHLEDPHAIGSLCALDPHCALRGDVIPCPHHVSTPPAQGEWVVRLIGELSDALDECDKITPLCDCRDNDGDPYPSQWLADVRAKAAGFLSAQVTAPQPAPAPVQGWPDAGVYLVYYDDRDQGQVLFAGAGARDAAAKFYADTSLNWNAHLFVKIDSNSRCEKSLNAHPPASAADGAGELPPIERDEAFDRDYIPLPGGWEVQTKGSGSTFRICDTKSGERMPVVETMLHPWLERMAREVHAAIAALAQQRIPESVRAVLADLDRATRKFPTWPTDPLHAVAVLGEEAGELTKAVLQAVYEPHKSTPEDVATEATQTAAMALRFIDSLPRYVYARGEQHSQQEARGNGE